MSKAFSKLYMDAEECVTAFRKAVDEDSSIEDLNDVRYELCTLRSYVQTAINEIEWLRDKYFKE